MKTAKFTFLLIMSLSICIIACSSDNDDETTNPPTEISEAPEDNLPEEVKAFLGYWVNQGNKGGDFIFWSDGTCWQLPGSYDISYHQEGYWTYDTTTKILATTTGQWQWQITLSNSEAWAGFSLGSSKTTYTFKRGDNLSFMKALLSGSSWEESADSTMTLSQYYYKDYNYYFYSGSLHFINKPLVYKNSYTNGRVLCIEEDKNTNDYVFNYILGELGHTYSGDDVLRRISSGSVTLKNPYNLKKQRLEFTGPVNKTLYRVTKSKE